MRETLLSKASNGGAVSPLVIGGVGGSGTGVVARIVAQARFMGSNLNRAYDALDFADFDWRWGRRYLSARIYGVPLARERMRVDIQQVVERHLAPLAGERRPWGWKHPHSILLLPFLHQLYPTLRFVHVIRDGRDMAFSENVNQLMRYGDLVVPGRRRAARPADAIAYWAWANRSAAEYGETGMGGSYLRLRFEDLCEAPFATALDLLRWSGAGGSAPRLARQAIDLVVPPDTLGRWTAAPPRAVAAVVETGQDALTRFGYCDDRQPRQAGRARALR